MLEREQTMRFVGGVFRHDRKNDFAGAQIFQSLRARHQFALRWKNRRDPNQILGGDAGIPQGQLKRRETFAMFPTPLVKKIRLGTMSLANSIFLQRRFR